MAVYFIRDEHDRVKIGVTRDKDAAYRLERMQNANADQLTVVRLIVDAGHVTEKWFHQHYAARRIRNEWFRYCPTMLTMAPPTTLVEVALRQRKYDVGKVRLGFVAAREANMKVGDARRRVNASVSTREAAAKHGISLRTVERARTILIHGTRKDEADILAARVSLSARAFELRRAMARHRVP